MTVATASYESLLDYASEAGCAGIEIRDDLQTALFDGRSPREAGDAARASGLEIFALAEVQAFNQFTEETRARAAQLIETASACGAQAVSLIPAIDCKFAGGSHLLRALQLLQPMLRAHGLTGLIEPLGFANASLRFKADAVAAIDELDARDVFKIVHDTFHHHLAGEQSIYPEHTGIVHVSGVVDAALEPAAMLDRHRVLVGAGDRLQNVEQLSRLIDAGYDGPVSIEAFAPQVHQMTHPVPQLVESYRYIVNRLRASAA